MYNYGTKHDWPDVYLENSFATIRSTKENTSIPIRAWLWYCVGIDFHISSTGA